MKKPDCIRHWRDVEGADDSTYPDSDERFSIGAPLARKLGLGRIGIHHERLPPGRRTSYPHAESDEEEFVYVLEGHPEAWINGYLWKLEPGDSVGVSCRNRYLPHLYQQHGRRGAVTGRWRGQ